MYEEKRNINEVLAEKSVTLKNIANFIEKWHRQAQSLF
jgi:hypothetical protein